MYRVKEVEIKGFWHRYSAKCEFNNDVNIIIGRNGTGKTTFMNILNAALSVDLDALGEAEFDEVLIRLSMGRKIKTIKVKKWIPVESLYQVVEYQVSSRKYSLRSVPMDERRISPVIRRRALEEASYLKTVLSKIVSLSSISVYRLRGGEDFEIKDKAGKRLVSPVDFRLSMLTIELTQYQLELSQNARKISGDLQKEVLASILYDPQDDALELKIPKRFDKDKEREGLVTAYKRLGVMDSKIIKKITSHVESVDDAIRNLDVYSKGDKSINIDFAAVEAYVRTSIVVSRSLEAEEKIKEIFSRTDLFLKIIKGFVVDKSFLFNPTGELVVLSASGDAIPLDRLSSGEKQLLILMIEALLQKGQEHIFLTDEPEISLHIEWQRKILPAVKELNPNAQIVAATHSPEVAARYKSSMIDMRDIVNA